MRSWTPLTVALGVIGSSAPARARATEVEATELIAPDGFGGSGAFDGASRIAGAAGDDAGGWGAGDLRRSQAWYRDDASGGSPRGDSLNTTNEVELSFAQ